MKSALIIGGGSAIGSALVQRLRQKNIAVESTTRATLDLAAAPGNWPQLPACDVAYLCAAVTKLDACEKDPAGTALVNVHHTAELAKRLSAHGSFVVFLSSNHVFDGSKPHRRFDDPTSPANEYGRQKAQTEQAILALGSSAVLRLTKVITTPFPLFEQWKQKLLAGEPIRAFTDMAVAPVPLPLVLDALLAVGELKQPGIWQLSAPRDATYHELALRLAEKIGADASLVEASTSAEAGIPAAFSPRHSTYAQHLPTNLTVPDPRELLP